LLPQPGSLCGIIHQMHRLCIRLIGNSELVPTLLMLTQLKSHVIKNGTGCTWDFESRAVSNSK
jgi:hypothetical protein